MSMNALAKLLSLFLQHDEYKQALDKLSGSSMMLIDYTLMIHAQTNSIQQSVHCFSCMLSVMWLKVMITVVQVMLNKDSLFIR